MIFPEFFRFPGWKILKNIEISIHMMYILITDIVEFIGMNDSYVSLHRVFKMTTIFFNAESKHLQTWAGKLAASWKMPNYSKIDCYTWKSLLIIKIRIWGRHTYHWYELEIDLRWFYSHFILFKPLWNALYISIEPKI